MLLRAYFLIGVTLAASLAVGAASSSAHVFTGERPKEPEVWNVAEQQLVFPPFTVTCQRAASLKSGNVVAFPAPTLFVELRYRGCKALAASLPGKLKRGVGASFGGPVDFEFGADGWVAVGADSESSHELEGAKPVEIAMRAIRCTIVWNAQTTPAGAPGEAGSEYDAASYERESFEFGPPEIGEEKEGLRIQNRYGGMEYSLSGPGCGAFEGVQANGGTYGGMMVADLRGNDSLYWE